MKMKDVVCRYLNPSSPQRASPSASAPGHSTASFEHLPGSVIDWPARWQEAYEERAAIIEFCAGKSRREAETAAESEVRSHFYESSEHTENR